MYWVQQRGNMRHCLQLEIPLPEPSTTPIYFKELLLENVRSFSEQQKLKLVDEKDRPARWTLILGDNGIGKTTLLQCLAHMRPVFNENPDEGAGTLPNPIEPMLASEDDNNAIMGLVRAPGDIEARLEAQLSFGVALSDSEHPNGNDISTLSDSEHPNGNDISTSLMIKRTGDNITEFIADGEYSKTGEKPGREPLVLAYGAGRHPKGADQLLKRAVGNNISATDPVASLFAIEASLCDAEGLLHQLEYYSMRQNSNATKLLCKLKAMLAEILPDIGNPDDIKILGPPSRIVSLGETGTQVTTSYGTVSIQQLSLGYQTMIAWTVDIALGLLEYFPYSSNPLHEPATVIVDEIDLHLHPRWQREIREHLTKHFPNIQFIATAHSPLMAQTFLGNNLVVLKRSGDHAQIINDPHLIAEWRIDEIITSELFGILSPHSPNFEKALDRRKKLIEKKNRSKDEETELRELDRQVAELSKGYSREDQEAMDIIRRAAAAIQSKDKAP